MVPMREVSEGKHFLILHNFDSFRNQVKSLGREHYLNGVTALRVRIWEVPNSIIPMHRVVDIASARETRQTRFVSRQVPRGCLPGLRAETAADEALDLMQQRPPMR